jgi:hypothetical protein
MAKKINRKTSDHERRRPSAVSLVFDAKRRQHYSLGELLVRCKPSVRRSREDRDWLARPPAGRELI